MTRFVHCQCYSKAESSVKNYLLMFVALAFFGCKDSSTPLVPSEDEKIVRERGKRRFELTVAHLTDPHIFDDKSKNIEPARDDEGCLNFKLLDHAIAAINEQSAQEMVDVVVVTGDLGIEKVIEAAGIECKKAKITLDANGRVLFDGVSKDKEIDESLDKGAQALANSIAQSKIADWLFVNGNNDLCNEDSKTLAIFKTYLEKVSTYLATQKSAVHVHNLVADGDNVAPFVSPTSPRHVFIGFENGSFKNNHLAEYADNLNKDFQTKILDALEEEIARQKKAQRNIHLVFHAPHFDDPFNASTARNECPKRVPTNVVFENNCAQMKPKIATNATKNIYSAWLLPDASRNRWDALIAKPEVKTLFAGHFHSQNRADYLNPSAYQIESYAHINKYNVAPPISIKNQTVENGVNQARGFSIVRLLPNGTREVTYYWANQNNNGTCEEATLSSWEGQQV